MTTAVVHPGDALHPGRRLATVVILGVLVALGPFTIDLYLPAFPSVRSSFGVSDVAIQLTLSGTVVGFAVGQLLVGPWSDRVGRRVPLLVTTMHPHHGLPARRGGAERRRARGAARAAGRGRRGWRRGRRRR